MQNDNKNQPPRWFYALNAFIGVVIIQVVQFYGISLWIGFTIAIAVALVLMAIWRKTAKNRE